MARYLAVMAVRAEGRRVVPAKTSDAEPPAVAKGERLVAVVNNGEWQAALDVTFPAFYAKVQRRFREGIWKAMELYRIDEKRAAELEDGRRILMNGQPVPDPGRA